MEKDMQYLQEILSHLFQKSFQGSRALATIFKLPFLNSNHKKNSLSKLATYSTMSNPLYTN